MANQPKAVGSIWNVNSWHWEMKNYTEATKKILEQKFLELTFECPDSIVVKHTQVKFPKAEAEVNIRKGKQILIYDFEVELEVQAEGPQDSTKGSYKIREIQSDDLTDMLIEDVKAT